MDDLRMDKETLIDRIKRHEGLRLQPYMDSFDNITIGYGRNLSAVGIDQYEADMMFNADLRRAMRLAELHFGNYGIGPVRIDVLIEMIFQLGINAVMKFHRMIDAIKANDFEKAADEMLDSKWHEQTPSRCRELTEIMRAGK